MVQHYIKNRLSYQKDYDDQSASDDIEHNML